MDRTPTDATGVSAGDDWELVAWLRGSTAYGQGRYARADGTRALVTFTRPQTVPVDELARRLRSKAPGIAELLSIDAVDEGAVMREVEPSGEPLSMRGARLAPEIALRLLGGIADILARAAATGEILGGIRPELIYAGPELQITGIAPRAEIFASTMVEPLDLVPTFPFEALYAAPELFTGGARSPAADVYSACAVFHHALTHRAPFASGVAGASIIEQGVEGGVSGHRAGARCSWLSRRTAAQVWSGAAGGLIEAPTHLASSSARGARPSVRRKRRISHRGRQPSHQRIQRASYR